MPQLAAQPTKIGKMTGNYFLKNCDKNLISYIKLDGFQKLGPTHISGTWVKNRQSDVLRKKPPKKIQKSRDFRGIPEISGTNVDFCIKDK